MHLNGSLILPQKNQIKNERKRNTKNTEYGCRRKTTTATTKKHTQATRQWKFKGNGKEGDRGKQDTDCIRILSNNVLYPLHENCKWMRY